MYDCRGLTYPLADSAESNARRLWARLTTAELTKEAAARELEGLRARTLDAAVFLGERSEEIGALEASGGARRKEV